uniref:Fibronectin type-III domain-containing protein n=1 Tax=Taenia asiatica TaxID=60517 RepID=A0A0R3WHD7_TAEAS
LAFHWAWEEEEEWGAGMTVPPTSSPLSLFQPAANAYAMHLQSATTVAVTWRLYWQGERASGRAGGQ